MRLLGSLYTESEEPEETNLSSAPLPDERPIG
jgi:hypothetical protein